MIDMQIAGVYNDLVISNGDIQLVSSNDQILQAVLQNLQSFAGEWFLDNTFGIPYFQNIFVKNPQLDLIQLILVNAILQTPGIAQINQFTFNYDNGLRTLTVVFSAKTTNGQTITAQKSIGA